MSKSNNATNMFVLAADQTDLQTNNTASNVSFDLAQNANSTTHIINTGISNIGKIVMNPGVKIIVPGSILDSVLEKIEIPQNPEVKSVGEDQFEITYVCDSN